MINQSEKKKKEKIHWRKKIKEKEKLRLKEIIDTNFKFYSTKKNETDT
jgi:hypothetical protein